jgi:hypothetical protein
MATTIAGVMEGNVGNCASLASIRRSLASKVEATATLSQYVRSIVAGRALVPAAGMDF